MTAFEDALRDTKLVMVRTRFKGSPYFLPTCPRCSHRNWRDAKSCSECGTRLYPSEAEIESAKL